MKRYIVEIEGKWQGGSFASENEANAVGRKSGKGYVVRERSISSSPQAAPLATDAEVRQSFNRLAAERDDLARQAQRARDQRDAAEARVVELEKAAAEKAAAESTPDKKTTLDANTKK